MERSSTKMQRMLTIMRVVQRIFLTHKNKQFKKCVVLCWLGFLHTTDDEYRFSCLHTEGCKDSVGFVEMVVRVWVIYFYLLFFHHPFHFQKSPTHKPFWMIHQQCILSLWISGKYIDAIKTDVQHLKM